MKKFLFSIIFIMLFSVVVPDAKAEETSTRNTKELIQLLIKGGYNTKTAKVKKKKLKKIVRKAGRVYRTVKKDPDSRKKSRKVQRTARRVINIF